MSSRLTSLMRIVLQFPCFDSGIIFRKRALSSVFGWGMSDRGLLIAIGVLTLPIICHCCVPSISLTGMAVRHALQAMPSAVLPCV